MAALAQDPILQDLVGVRGRDGERILQERGYEFRWADNSSGTSVYSYWTNYNTGQCITVRTEEGRYASIVTSPRLIVIRAIRLTLKTGNIPLIAVWLICWVYGLALVSKRYKIAATSTLAANSWITALPPIGLKAARAIVWK
jgi:hypothetical protein